MTINEIILKITGRSNVKPAVAQAKRDVNEGFDMHDLVGRGPSWARHLMHGFVGGLLGIAAKVGYELGAKIEEGLSDSSGFIGHFWKQFESYAVKAALEAEKKLTSLSEWAAKAAKESETIRLKHLNEDLQRALAGIEVFASRLTLAQQKARAVELYKTGTAVMNARGSDETLSVTQAAGAAEQGNKVFDTKKLLELKQEEAETNQKALDIEKKRKAELQAQLEVAHKKTTMAGDVLASHMANSSSYVGAAIDAGKSTQLSASLQSAQNEEKSIRERLHLNDEEVKKLKAAQEQKDLGVDIAKDQLSLEEQIRAALEERYAAEKKVNFEKQQALRLTAALDRIENGAPKRAEEPMLGVSEVDDTEHGIIGHHNRGIGDAGLSEQIDRINPRGNRNAQKVERAANRFRKSAQNAASEYMKQAGRVLGLTDDEDINSVLQGPKTPKQIKALARLGNGKGSRAYMATVNAMRAEKERVEREKMEVDSWKAAIDSKGLLQEVIRKLDK